MLPPPACLPRQADLDDVEAHVDDMLGAGAVVPGPGVALEGVAEVPTVQVMVAQVVVAAPDALLDGVAFVVLQVRVQLLQLQQGLLPRGLHPGRVQGWGLHATLRDGIGCVLQLPERGPGHQDGDGHRGQGGGEEAANLRLPSKAQLAHRWALPTSLKPHLQGPVCTRDTELLPPGACSQVGKPAGRQPLSHSLQQLPLESNPCVHTHRALLLLAKRQREIYLPNFPAQGWELQDTGRGPSPRHLLPWWPLLPLTKPLASPGGL